MDGVIEVCLTTSMIANRYIQTPRLYRTLNKNGGMKFNELLVYRVCQCKESVIINLKLTYVKRLNF